MKKLLLLLAGLLFAVLPSFGQNKTANITDRIVIQSADLTSGYYLINCYIPKTEQDGEVVKPQGSLYFNSSRNDRPFNVTSDGFIFEGKTQVDYDQAKYIWYVSKNEDGQIKIRNISQKIYLPVDVNRNNNMADPATKAAAEFTGIDKSITDDLGRDLTGIVLMTAQTDVENGQTLNRTIYANWETGKDPNLSYWSTGGGEIMFQFVEVTDVNFNITYPFHTSAAPANDEFNANTKWQLLNIKADNQYLYYTDENTHIKPANSYTSNGSVVEDKFLWAFHVNPDGNIVIYNKAAGATKVLAAGEMSGNNGGGTFPQFVNANNIPENQIATWNALKSIKVSGKDGFFLYRGENQAEKMNLRENNGSYELSFWTGGADDGSTFWVTPYVNYTIKYVNGEGEELQEPTVGYGVAGTNISIPETLKNLVPKSARDNNGNELAIENNSITLPESYDCVITVNYKDNFQFETTRIIDGNFASDTKWYYLKLNNRYLSFNDVLEEYHYTSDATTEPQTFVYSYSSNPLNYGCFWAFVKDGDDLKIYNAATGTSMVLASKGSEERVFYPTMMTPNTEGYTDSWHYKVAQDDTKFYLFLKGTDTNDDKVLYGDGDNRLNCYGITGANPNNYLTFSTGDGDWSYFTVEPVNVPTLINNTKASQQAIEGAVGTLENNSYKEFIDALNTGTAEGLSKALRIQGRTDNKIQFNVNNTYYLFAYASASATKYMHINNDASLNSGNKQTDNASIIWKFSGDESNGYKISGQGKYLNKVTNNSASIPTVSNEDAAASYNLMKVPNKAAAFYIRPTDGKGLHIDASGNVVGWNEGGGSEWYLIEAPSIDITISSAGYTTVNYPFAVELPEDQDITAYFATIIDGNKNNLMLRKVYSGHIPANTPVVLQGTPNTYTLNIVSEDKPTNISNNILEGTLLSETMGAGDIFVLSKPENKNVGFYLLNDAENANRTIPANKAYLPGSNLPVTSQGVRGFTFSFEDSDGETTDIENEIVDLSQEEFYDLQGRRVQNPTKGIYVTKSGKKILFVK